ncbi:hypothetical protein VCHA37P194_190066 [Vibrio chagasii]|nr:hypothetical protein VCHA37P194_190066 [Vibrio chagasii]CAH7150623.1 hypothetical protein VCHA53O469_210010 [Vibrio chagasii]
MKEVTRLSQSLVGENVLNLRTWYSFIFVYVLSLTRATQYPLVLCISALNALPSQM